LKKTAVGEITLKVTEGHRKCRYSISHIFDFLLAVFCDELIGVCLYLASFPKYCHL